MNRMIRNGFRGIPIVLICLLFGCEFALLPFMVEEERQTMDLIEQSAAPADETWRAAMQTTRDLDIQVDAEHFVHGEGVIQGHTGDLGFIRIYVSSVTARSTRVRIQSRTQSYPLSKAGYDRDFSQTIMDRIHINAHSAYDSEAEESSAAD